MKNVYSYDVSELVCGREDPAALVETMLKKAGAVDYVFGDADDMIAWSVAAVDDELYARKALKTSCGATIVEHYCIPWSDRENAIRLFDSVAMDVAVYSFGGFLDPLDSGLNALLTVFNRKYSNFLSRVMYWQTILPLGAEALRGGL